MILEFVTFRSPPGQDRAAVLEDAKSVIPRWKANPDLLRKHFLLGQNGEGAGVYIWPSVEAAQKAHDDHWRDAVIKRTGGAYESATIATAIPGRLKAMAGRIAEQYKQVSPEKAPTVEFRRLAPRK